MSGKCTPRSLISSTSALLTIRSFTNRIIFTADAVVTVSFAVVQFEAESCLGHSCLPSSSRGTVRLAHFLHWHTAKHWLHAFLQLPRCVLQSDLDRLPEVSEPRIYCILARLFLDPILVQRYCRSVIMRAH